MFCLCSKPTFVGRCYPSRGSEEMAIELARVICDNGGTDDIHQFKYYFNHSVTLSSIL